MAFYNQNIITGKMYSSVESHQPDKNNQSVKQVTFMRIEKNKLSDWLLEFFSKIIIIIALVLTVARLSILKHEQQLLLNAIKNIREYKDTRQIKTWDELIEASSFQYPKQISQIQITKQRRKQGIDKNVQVGSQLDYLKINESLSFQLFKENYLKLAPHEILEFKYNQSLQQPEPNINIFEHFKSQEQIEDFLSQNSKTYFFLPYHKDVQAHLASVLHWNSTQKKYLDAQYYLMDKKYNLSKIKQQIPICVISTGYKLFTKNKYKPYFETIQRQNYSNYKIVLVDDHSPDGSALEYMKYLEKTDFRLKNRLKIVHTLQNLGALANMYIWVQKYCDPDSVVVNIDADDSLIGRQAFNVINANYQNPNIWYIYTRFLWQNGPNGFINLIPSYKLDVPIKKYRGTSYWGTSHMRTYRQKLMANSPLQHYIEYRYNETTEKMVPSFHLSSADRFQIYTHLEMSGDQRIKFITEMLYYYEIDSVSKIDCYRQFQIIEQFKSRSKIPLIPLKSLDSACEFDYSTPLDNYMYLGFKNSYDEYQSCMRSVQ